MKLLKTSLAAIALASLAACGGDDTDDRLNIADPAVRFVDVAPFASNVTIYRNEVAQSDAGNFGYKSASRYYDVSGEEADWSIRPTTSTTTLLSSVRFDADRGDRNTIVALPNGTGMDALLVRDPYNKSLSSNDARVRVVNAASNAGAVDVYLTRDNASIVNATPSFANVRFKQSVPSSGADSVEFDGGTYRLVATASGSKTPIFSATVDLGDNADWLLLPIPAVDGAVDTSGAIKFLLVEGNKSDTVSREIVSAP
ncbi:MAG: hypothetical protein JWQ11_22 [Rhizobacter sp.]|nr:hypothetical protein [Rhizobacter sp.]